MEENKFVKNLREAKNYSNEEAERKSNIVEEWDSLSDQFMDAYNDYRKSSGAKTINRDDSRTMLRNFIGKAGVADGKWTQEDYDNADYDEYDFQEYGTQLMKDLIGEVGGMDFKTYVEKNGTKEQQETYKRLTKETSAGEKVAKGLGGAAIAGGLLALGPAGWLGGAIGFNLAAVKDKKQRESLEKLQQQYLNSHKEALNSAFDMYENADTYLANRPADAGSGSSTGSGSKTGGSSDEYIEFSLDRANDPNYKGFGQKILDLGINTDNGLWGENGDVAYYTKQLNDQGIYGNLPVGKTIRLKRRK